MSAPTPLMQQYFALKEQFDDALLFFQVGDFYELFFDDAKTAAAFLGIALTKRGTNNGEPIPLCGVPIHAVDHYITKLIRGGFKVALCDQLEPATPGKVVERGITRVLTPGTLTDAQLLDDKSASYLLSCFPAQDQWALVFGELLTAQLFATIIPAHAARSVETELARYFPDEIIVPGTQEGKASATLFKAQGYVVTFAQFYEQELPVVQEWSQSLQVTLRERALGHSSMRHALENFHGYLEKNRQGSLAQFKQFHFYEPDEFLLLDRATQKNLELVQNNQDGGRKNTLCALLDGAVTGMGSRMIKKWIMRPLIKQQSIVQRHDAVERLSVLQLRQQVEQLLVHVGDIERVIGRIALRRATMHDYGALMRALVVFPELRNLVRHADAQLLQIIVASIEDFSSLHALLYAACNDDATQPWLIKKGFDQQLDMLRDLVESAHQKIIELEQREQQSTGINSLKVRYNKVHGYYIEITKANMDAVPTHYKRQQTLVGKERYMTDELQHLQHDIFRARNEIDEVEKAVFDRVKQEVAQFISPLRKAAHALAHLDALLGFARVAYDNGYVRPAFNSDRSFMITNGRHPVVEKNVAHAFIPNDTQLDDEQSLWIITGPNMGGKSTYLRQVALSSIMAQCGSFVAAEAAELPLVDRIFTRIGAGDNVAEGKSTFLVEMEETASICTQATERSLVILDEVGRGTSTFDGLAIAQAVVEYLHTRVRARCLFATHYHELTHLEAQFPGVVSYYAASKKGARGIMFLHKIVRGVADGSFGVDVAQLAGLPAPVIERARELVASLAVAERLGNSGAEDAQIIGQLEGMRAQLMRQQAEADRLRHELRVYRDRLAMVEQLDFDDLSPKKAFDLLWQLRNHN